MIVVGIEGETSATEASIPGRGRIAEKLPKVFQRQIVMSCKIHGLMDEGVAAVQIGIAQVDGMTEVRSLNMTEGGGLFVEQRAGS